MPENDSGIAWQVPTYDCKYECAVYGRRWASKTAASFCCTDDD